MLHSSLDDLVTVCIFFYVDVQCSGCPTRFERAKQSGFALIVESTRACKKGLPRVNRWGGSPTWGWGTGMMQNYTGHSNLSYLFQSASWKVIVYDSDRFQTFNVRLCISDRSSDDALKSKKVKTDCQMWTYHEIIIVRKKLWRRKRMSGTVTREWRMNW